MHGGSDNIVIALLSQLLHILRGQQKPAGRPFKHFFFPEREKIKTENVPMCSGPIGEIGKEAPILFFGIISMAHVWPHAPY